MIFEPEIELATWKLDAECRGMDPEEAMEIFFPPSALDMGIDAKVSQYDRQHVYDRARAICARCPVQEECYQEAMSEPVYQSYQIGFRGGLSPAQRLKRYYREHEPRRLEGWG